jgi:hypothetical protein
MRGRHQGQSKAWLKVWISRSVAFLSEMIRRAAQRGVQTMTTSLLSIKAQVMKRVSP